ncbi:MAG: hypothetical protein DBX61_04585, partial [Clostridiales bacterium]
VERVRTPSAYFFGTFFRTSEKSAAAKRRCNTRERASENNKFNFSRKQARLCGINSTAQTHIKNKIKFFCAAFLRKKSRH